jgi:hypothetical protein
VLPLQRRQARRLFADARGRTDFRGVQASYDHREAGCVFCAPEGSGRVLLENELALCIADAYPVSEGHCLEIPRRHRSARPQRWGRRRGEGESSAGGQGGRADALVRSTAG